MIYYVENRVWYLEAHLTLQDKEDVLVAELKKRRNQLWENIQVVFKSNAFDEQYANSEKFLEVTIVGSNLNLFQEKLLNLSPSLDIQSIILRILPFGFLNITSIFEVRPSELAIDPRELERQGMRASEVLDSLKPELDYFIDVLCENHVLEESKEYHFGVPKLLRVADLHNELESYLYNQHLFLFSEDDFLEINSKADLVESVFAYEGCRVRTKWAFNYWLIPDDIANEKSFASDGGATITRLLSMDTMGLSESVIYDNAVFCYTGFLDLLSRLKGLKSSLIRNIINRTNFRLQKIRLYRRNMTIEQNSYIRHYALTADFDRRRMLLDRAEKSLFFAVEGLEAEESERISRHIQYVMLFFTGMTCYSLGNDILSILRSSGVPENNLHSFPTIVLEIITLIILISGWWVLRKIKR